MSIYVVCIIWVMLFSYIRLRHDMRSSAGGSFVDFQKIETYSAIIVSEFWSLHINNY